ncbi:hypothetical protein C8Q75DRAFT_810392 [Abortiporus biennis]|nr:hypothetical protein C8Q75DRAFT_810392 [Abortiporus biennis]
MTDTGPHNYNANNASFAGPTSHHSSSQAQKRPRPLMPNIEIPSAQFSVSTSAEQGYSVLSPSMESPSIEPEICWNLIPYDVPWGADYYNYKAGQLPGPDGQCLFLRSPTPVEKRRTAQACKSCRERKAKCSGERPACERCVSRGLLCVYAVEQKRVTKPAPRLREGRSFSHPYLRRDSDAHSVASADTSNSAPHSPKQEEEEYFISQPPALYYSYDSPESISSPILAYPDTPREEYSQEITVSHQPQQPQMQQPLWNEQECIPPQPITPPTLLNLHAPRPLRYSQSLPFLPSSEHKTFLADPVAVRSRSIQQEGPTTIDPSVLTYQPPTPHQPPHPQSTSSHVQYVDYMEMVSDEPPRTIVEQTWLVDQSQCYVASQTGDGYAALMQQYFNVAAYVEQPVYENPAIAQHSMIPPHVQQYTHSSNDGYEYQSLASVAATIFA